MIAIDAPHFYAAVLLDSSGIVIRAAPILKYMLGWSETRVRAYAQRKGWKLPR